MGEINTVGVVLHPKRDSAEAVDAILTWAEARRVTVLGLADEVTRLNCAAIPSTAEELATKADLIVGLGGDGTVLRALRLSDGLQTPVLGVNLGKLGFLAEVDVVDLPSALSAIDAHDYVVEARTAVRASIGGARFTAFNDIVAVRVPGDGVAAIGLSVQGHPFVNYAADAVIVSTPTGSTAYSFSAGGPIMSPSVGGLIVIPSAPHSAFNRAVILDCSQHLALLVLPTSGHLAVEVDGQVLTTVAPGDVIDVTADTAAGLVIRLGRTTFYQRAQRKLRLTGSAEAE